MLFPIDLNSFLLGLAVASIFWWLVARARPLFGEMRGSWRERREAAQARRSSGVEENHRRITLRRAQGLHLAAPLFALDEIMQEPRLMAPLPTVVPGTAPCAEDAVTETLPYLPTWPEMAAIYNYPSLSVAEALSGGRHIVITGHPGAGKSVMLAHLASLAANRSELLGQLKDYVPFLLHVADLRLPASDPDEVLTPVVEVCDAFAPVLDLTRLPGFIEQSFKNGRALLLLDGYDELPDDGQRAVADYLKLLLQTYPKTRVVTTGAFERLDGLIKLNFAPMAVMAWTRKGADEFIKRWGEQWMQYVSRESWAQSGPDMADPLLLNSWLSVGNASLTPLELTLKVWGAYAGDSLGPQVIDAIATHIRRLAPRNTPVAALDTLALQVVATSQPVFDPRKANEWVSKFEAVTTGPAPAEVAAEPEPEEAGSKNKKKKPKKDEKLEAPAAPSSNLLTRMSNSGLLITHPNSYMRFAHPVFEAFLAGRGLNDRDVTETILKQPDWLGKVTALRYLATRADMTRMVDQLLEWSRLPMHRPLFLASRWLRDAPRDAPWRSKVMAALVKLMQTEGLPMGLRGQAVAAFVFSNDAGAAPLFRQFTNTLSFDLVQLCALGSGAVQDTKAVPQLQGLLEAPSLGARRAALLALVSIGSNEALEAVAHSLLSGDEMLRQAAAEALANDPVEGHAMLRDGTTMSDILVRRAVVAGLARISDTWSTEILQALQVDDEQWVVRNAAGEALELRSRADARAPRLLPAPSKSPWLLEFAGSLGVGIPPGSSGTEVLISALKSESSETRLAALSYLKMAPTQPVVMQLYHAMYSDDAKLREAIYMALMEIAAGGIKLPHPSQFGLG
jgi:energy-coupling factor transporter ATP-binding protein EcfA2